jgi:hypothetical protein
MRRQIVFPLLAIAAIGSILLSGRLVYDYARLVMVFPVIAGLLVIVLCLVQIAIEAVPAGLNTALQRKPTSLGREFRTLLRIAAILPCVWIFGYAVGPSLYLLLWLRLHEENWKITLGLGLGAFSLTYGLFGMVLGVSLPKGLLM